MHVYHNPKGPMRQISIQNMQIFLEIILVSGMFGIGTDIIGTLHPKGWTLQQVELNVVVIVCQRLDVVLSVDGGIESARSPGPQYGRQLSL